MLPLNYCCEAIIIIISQRAATVTSPAWLAYVLPMVFYSSFFFFFFLFIPGVISAVTYPIAEFFLPTHVPCLRDVNARLEFRKS